MQWTVINKKKTTPQKQISKYGDYKSYLRDEAKNRCVYCAIHENSLGGVDHFHIEHYKPQSKFPELINNYNNLFYSCPICNRFKSNDWPNEPNQDHSVISYPNPNGTNYNELFDIDEHGILKSTLVAPSYVINKLCLNRPQLINERNHVEIDKRLTNALEILRLHVEHLQQRIKDPKAVSFLFKIIEIQRDSCKLMIECRTICSYEPEEIQRPK
ncbi:MAG: HNH endonuclease [Candidatus Tenebribacter davisii]|nr:HNH endonuclease [Candidatus Tenebribacter davisii]